MTKFKFSKLMKMPQIYEFYIKIEHNVIKNIKNC